MARLHEHQGKSLLANEKIGIPRGEAARTPAEAKRISQDLDCEVVVKGQAWVTGRASLGVIKFADSPEATAAAASAILGMEVGGFVIDTVLVEEKLNVKQEFYAGVIIDDIAQAPRIIFSSKGGSGVEQIASEHPDALAQTLVDIQVGFPDYCARDLVRQVGIQGKLQLTLGLLLSRLYTVARNSDARAAEINPVALTEEGKLIAADCRITVDDYAVFRQPGLEIEVAREFDRPPTELERIAWEIEKSDYRGTFYFIQMEQDFKRGDKVIGFHGAGGGGSMMSMDAILNKGYKLANFVDTSGNPPASKVYRAARVILAQGPIDGYFSSGSGVASQEQFHSARGLAKAFLEAPLNVPAVIRLGGNAEDRAIAIMERVNDILPAPIEAYGKDDSPDFCSNRLDDLIRNFVPIEDSMPPIDKPQSAESYQFETISGGTVLFDYAACRQCDSHICIDTCVPEILSLEDDLPVLNISAEDARKGGCIECLACQVECHFGGNRGGYVELPIPGLD
ncbi:MAG: acetate--CoA ligase family protein [Anaerolineales bacterium]|nr:acetate--CoA ligase family protein [Anaerolineales bacterium]